MHLIQKFIKWCLRSTLIRYEPALIALLTEPADPQLAKVQLQMQKVQTPLKVEDVITLEGETEIQIVQEHSFKFSKKMGSYNNAYKLLNQKAYETLKRYIKREKEQKESLHQLAECFKQMNKLY